MSTFFSDYFGLSEGMVDDFGAFNISLVNDLPLFIDPFLLFHSEKAEYQALHKSIIDYLIFLKNRAVAGQTNKGLLRSWYCFPEIRQNWLGFSLSGNSGSGLGMDFAEALHSSLHKIFSNFGREDVTEGSHLEKVCLIADGVGRDSISDFTTNLILDHLCRYTQTFAATFLQASQTKEVAVRKAFFNYQTEAWVTRRYRLPWANGDYVLLSPKDMLTRDDTWINKDDLIGQFDQIPTAIPDPELRAAVSNYFERELWREERNRERTARDRAAAAKSTLREFPTLIDYFIKLKEQTGDEAADVSSQKVMSTELTYVRQVQEIQVLLNSTTGFYQIAGTTYEEAHARLAFLKDVIENKGGHRLFYDGSKPIEREKDLQILYRLVWFGSPSDVTTEANDGRGPVDFKISRGAKDKTLVEMKLAKNTKLEKNLANQTPIYQAASDAPKAVKAIIFFTRDEEDRARAIVERLRLAESPDVVFIDARRDNKPSGSVA
jgi:hypothetical protein